MGLFIRMSVEESPAVEELKQKNKVAKLPIVAVPAVTGMGRASVPHSMYCAAMAGVLLSGRIWRL